MDSYSIRANVAKNRLYMSLSGFITDDQVTVAVELMISEIKKLKPGFSVINDISSFKPATPNGVREIQRAQLYVKQSGSGRIVRIVGPAGIASMQFSRIASSTGLEVDQAATIEDAEKLLDKI